MTNTPLPPRLTDPRQAADHLLMMLDRRHLSTPTFMLVGCDVRGHPQFHVHVVDCDTDVSPTLCAEVFDGVIAKYGHAEATPVAGVVLALTRPGGDEVLPYDRICFRALHRVCHHRGLDAFGVYVVTRMGARPVHIDDAA